MQIARDQGKPRHWPRHSLACGNKLLAADHKTFPESRTYMATMNDAKYIAQYCSVDGEKIVQEFEKLTDGIHWSLATDLQPGERIDIYFKGQRIYTNARPSEESET